MLVTCNGKVAMRKDGIYACEKCGREYHERQVYDICMNTVNREEKRKK